MPGRQLGQSGQDQLGALGLVLNTAVLWTTRYLNNGVTTLTLRALPADQREHEVLNEDVARLSPLRPSSRRGSGRASAVVRGPREPRGLEPIVTDIRAA
ncbi:MULTISPECIES: hypothetical protein [Streptomyces]|uniref:Tn3 transposase DDE domain-containing protein n=1 Tax=Streptomyces botrytidirepellens TaxID=2486417 RepID=A0A3M8WS92_9ACTN|nr:hypothetical protein [Streptomyces botrytidirepellens]RNG30963.1 hypothetical protein EEJ42_09155 [Streptomyces botrytidirepellens]